MKRVAVIAIFALTACASEPQVRELSDASINNLMAQPIPQFFASLRVANQLAEDCPNVAYDAQVAQAVTDAKTRSNFDAIQNAAAIEVESDIAWRSLNARFDGLNACDAARGEIERQSAISAVLVER